MKDIRGGYQEEEASERAMNDEERSRGNLGSPGGKQSQSRKGKGQRELGKENSSQWAAREWSGSL